jgi:uncharacterized protein
VNSPPTDAETVAAIRRAAASLSRAAGEKSGSAADDARRLANLLGTLAGADQAARARAVAAIIPPLTFDLAQLQKRLAPEPITIQALPADLARDWLAPNGAARVEVLPKARADDSADLARFAAAVLAAEPSATGDAITLYQSRNTVVAAFVQAGAIALAAIAVLLLIVLRRVGDVLLTLVPLLLAGAITLEIAVLIGLDLNFANVIALPLLLGVGVAFKIYYILAWRAGRSDLLQSSLTRAVVFSAMTNAAAFGSMWSSDYPGVSSMGKLMALSLACTMAAAVLFQPVLMGPPRKFESAH